MLDLHGRKLPALSILVRELTKKSYHRLLSLCSARGALPHSSNCGSGTTHSS